MKAHPRAAFCFRKYADTTLHNFDDVILNNHITTTKVETRQAHYDREIVFDRAAEATKSGKQIEDIKLGFEIGLSQVKGNVVTIKALDTNGLAAQMSGEAKICVGDTVLEVNGTGN